MNRNGKDGKSGERPAAGGSDRRPLRCPGERLAGEDEGSIRNGLRERAGIQAHLSGELARVRAMGYRW